MSASSQLSSSLVNLGMFLLNSFGMQKYLHWPCFSTLQRAKKEAGGSVGNNPPSLYCFPSVGLVFRVYMYSSLREQALGISQAENFIREASLCGRETGAQCQLRGFLGGQQAQPILCCTAEHRPVPAVSRAQVDGAGGWSGTSGTCAGKSKPLCCMRKERWGEFSPQCLW